MIPGTQVLPYGSLGKVLATIVLTVTLDGGRLLIDMNNGVKRPLTPVSETKFFFREADGSVEFAKNDQGRSLQSHPPKSMNGHFVYNGQKRPLNLCAM